MLRLLILIGGVLLLSNGQAHPVSFKNSIGLMGQHTPDLSHVQLNYSYRHWLAFGAHHYKRVAAEEDLHASFVSVNGLLKRWNGSKFQANIYGLLGVGQSELSGQSRTAGLGLLQFDIEDREYYFLAKHSQVLTEKETELMQSTLRFGLAPYVAPYGGVHSWFIFQIERREFTEEKQTTSLTPFLRVFHRNVLFEIGQSFDGQTRFNYISHF